DGNGPAPSPTPAPAVGAIAPSSGTTVGGMAVTITGTGFASGATVMIGGVAATSVNVVGSTSITATTPAHAAGGADVVVRNPDSQSGMLTNGFTYSAPGPAVNALSTSLGSTAGGTSVTISGSGFVSGATVTFGGTAATNVSVVSATSITATS